MNGEIDLDLAAAKRALFDVLGSTDPLAYHKAMRVALKHIEAAHVASREIGEICTASAKRGSYRNDP